MNQRADSERSRHLYSRLDTDLEELKQRVVMMGQAVDAQVARAIAAFIRRDAVEAEAVVAGDKRVNDLERELDERCVLALALLQPAASDLRFVAAVLKIVTDLERIGDFAVSIASSIPSLGTTRLRAEQELPVLGKAALRVLENALDAFVRRDIAEAQTARTADLPVTASLLELGDELKLEMKREPDLLENALATLFVTKYLERIAEHATNIAEMALYTERGEDVRHLPKQNP
jgi:phosphate transport system protein